MTEPVVKEFQAEVAQVLRLVIESLYSNREIFLRELISNASDALDRLRFRSVSEPELLGDDPELKIRIVPDRAAGTLTVWDNGVGMSADELTKNLGTIAWSGSRDFLAKLREGMQAGQQGMDLIGQFGVGFYSAYLVADRVDVVSRAAGTSEANRWHSDGKQRFSVEPAERAERGTSVVLHLKPDARDLLEPFRLRALITRYSDYIGHPIELAEEKEVEEGGVKRKREVFEAVNKASALWQRAPKDVEPAQYEEFYKHLSHDWAAPLAHKHFRIEGTQLFVGLLFIPSRRPLDLFEAEPKHGVRLHVKRVLVLEQCEELVPRWLRFVRGVIDSEDLPLNVSRELLQDSRAVKIIKKQIANQMLDLLEELAKDRPEDYARFFREFGTALKEGLHFEADARSRLARLMRYETTKGSELSSLAEYAERMPADQPAVYYATGLSRPMLEAGPHVQALVRRGYEVLLMTDPVDAFVVEQLEAPGGKPLISVTAADLKLGDEKGSTAEAQAVVAAPLIERFRKALEGKVSEVRVSTRLADAPACLVVPQGGLESHVERMLRLRNADLPQSKRILELNLEHPLIHGLGELCARSPDAPQIQDYVELVYDQALLAEGSPVDDPVRLARRIAELGSRVLAADARGPLGEAKG
jgi:molecular chaperone HtpG